MKTSVSLSIARRYVIVEVGPGNIGTIGFMTMSIGVSLSRDGTLLSLTSSSSSFSNGGWFTMVGGESAVSNGGNTTMSTGGNGWVFSFFFFQKALYKDLCYWSVVKEDYIIGGISIKSVISSDRVSITVASSTIMKEEVYWVTIDKGYKSWNCM